MTTVPDNATKPKTVSDVVKHETDPFTGRAAAKVLAGSGSVRAILLGAVVALTTLGTPTVAAKAGGNAANTGALTLDVTTPSRPGAKVGVYTVRCIAAASNSGTFRVEDPDGNVLGDVAVGATFDDDVKFVIADGSQDFIVGEGFDITVPAATTAKIVAWSPTGAGGAEVPAGIAMASVTAADGADSVDDLLFLKANALVDLGQLVWPDSVTSAQKAAALTALAARGITASHGY